jgi:hypothetical protein
MSSASVQFDGEGLGRREVLKRVAIGGGLAVAAFAAPGFTGVAEAKGGKSVVFDVDTQGFADFQGNVPGGAFYVSGDILSVGTTDEIGSFHCWGWIRLGDELGVVNQEFDLSDRGKILIAGVESDAPRAVTGGTGDFANARGEGIPDIGIFDFPNSGKFRISFSLTGASGPPVG